MRKLQIFILQVSDLFCLRDTRDAAISCKQYLFTLWGNARMSYLSVPVLYWSDALYNCGPEKALAESVWNYHIVRFEVNSGGMISAGALDSP